MRFHREALAPLQLMSDLTVKLLVAGVAASAVIFAALIGLWKDRKGRRDILLQDLEILDKLPKPSLNHIALATYVDRRALLLSVEDKVGMYLFLGVTAMIVFLCLTVALIVGLVTHHLLASALAAALMVSIAVLIVAYRLFKVKLSTAIEARIKTSTRSKAIELMTQTVDADMRDEIAETAYARFPKSLRSEVAGQIDPMIDTELARSIVASVDKFLSSDRYSDWSGVSPKTGHSGTLIVRRLRAKYTFAKLAVLKALLDWLTRSAQSRHIAKDDDQE